MAFEELAVAAASLCDPAALHASVNQLEDRAFAALKAANEAVAKAARQGRVGTAGNAEWETYKQLREQAEDLRIANAQSLASCPPPPSYSTASLAPLGSVARPDPVREPRPSGPRWTLAYTEGVARDHIKASEAIPMTLESGSYSFWTGMLRSPNPPPPPPLLTALPYPGGNASRDPTVSLGGAAAILSSRSWSDSHALSVAFAPGGQDAPGWRFEAKAEISDLTRKQALPHALHSALSFSDISAVTAQFGQQAPDYQYAYEYFYLGRFSQTHFTAGDRSVTDLDLYNISEKQSRRHVDATASYETWVATPIGRLALRPIGGLGLGWYDLTEQSALHLPAATNQPEATLLLDRRASGPGVRAFAGAEVTGRVWRSTPLTWSVSGQAGLESVALEIQDWRHGATWFRYSMPVSAVKLAFKYDVNDRAALSLDVSKIWEFYANFRHYQAAGTPLTDGGRVQLLVYDAVQYSASMYYAF